MSSEFEQRISEIDDITDSEAFDEVLIYIDQLQMQDEEFMEILVARRHEMIISWDQPWYQKTNCLTKKVFDNDHAQEKEGYEKEEFLTGPISSDESAQIVKNWKKLRKLFNLPDTPICLARWKNINKSRNPRTAEECARRFVTAFLAQGLQRHLHQVYRHFLIHYGYHARGFYTAFEEKVMNICQYHMPNNPVPTISLILGRDPRGIYKKFKQNDTETTKFEKKKWTLPESSKLLKLLMETTGLPLKKLKNKQFDTSVWYKMEDEMQRGKYSLQHHWYCTLHVQLFVKRDVKRKRLRRKIFKRLSKMPYKLWSDIRWKDVAKFYIDGFTHIFLYRQCYIALMRKEKFVRTPLSELIPYAFKVIKQMRSKRLQNLILNDKGELEECTYTNKDIEV